MFGIASARTTQFNAEPMISFLSHYVAIVEKLLKPRRKPLDHSRLMGMYLDQANRPAASASASVGTRERQDGKFAQTRRRADSLPEW